MERIKQRAWEAALAQVAIDYNARPEDFLREGVVVTEAGDLPGRRRYAPGAPFFQMVTTGKGAVITAHPSLHGRLKSWAGRCLDEKRESHRLFEYPKLRSLEDLLLPQGWRLMGVHHMFLPGREFSAALPEAFSYQWYDRETVKAFYPNRLWPNALSQEENSLRPDVIALAAFDGEKMAGLAGASADGETLWQVGIDVLPEYRSRGLGKALVEALCAKIAQQGRLPFYGAAAANLHSQNIAVSCGFFPAWVEVSSRQVSTETEELG